MSFDSPNVRTTIDFGVDYQAYDGSFEVHSSLFSALRQDDCSNVEEAELMMLTELLEGFGKNMNQNHS